jgi:long-chain fatty acid transport protein
VDYGRLDLRQGSSANFGLGVQAGLIYKILDSLSLGFNYISPQNVDHDNVFDFDGDGSLDTLKLEAPQQVGIGIAYTYGKLLLETDVKWINWSNANGYEDFDWEDQWVFAFGVQYTPIPKLSLRAGYNYGKNPVKEHRGFNGMQMISVQGKTMPTYYYETFRTIGFPAIVEHHLTAGVGYEFTPRFALHAGFMYAFENDIEGTGTDITGQPVSLKSTLKETSVEFGLTWRF